MHQWSGGYALTSPPVEPPLPCAVPPPGFTPPVISLPARTTYVIVV
nr:MAG TPA: hypothetical protein [Caudoviricetes sp.]